MSKKIIIILILGLLLTSCGLSNQQIITETKKCEDAGFAIKMLSNDFGVITKIQCHPM